MIFARRTALVVAGFLGVMGLVACDSNDGATPTSVTTPTPPTPPTTPRYSVSGTVFETAPTATTRVPEAEVQLTGGVALGTISDGTFTIPSVANGTYTLNVRKAGFETQTRQVTVSGADVTGVTVNLKPVFRLVDEIQDRRISQNDGACPGSSRACQLLRIASHHDGESRFFVAWNRVSDELNLEYWCNGTRVARSEFNGIMADEVKPNIVAGQSCELHIINASNTSFSYTLYLTYPY